MPGAPLVQNSVAGQIGACAGGVPERVVMGAASRDDDGLVSQLPEIVFLLPEYLYAIISLVHDNSIRLVKLPSPSPLPPHLVIKSPFELNF